MPSTPLASPQVISGCFASFRVVKSGVSAGQALLCAKFDSRQLHKEVSCELTGDFGRADRLITNRHGPTVGAASASSRSGDQAVAPAFRLGIKDGFGGARSSLQRLRVSSAKSDRGDIPLAHRGSIDALAKRTPLVMAGGRTISATSASEYVLISGSSSGIAHTGLGVPFGVAVSA
jgi:hypothetical protein